MVRVGVLIALRSRVEFQLSLLTWIRRSPLSSFCLTNLLVNRTRLSFTLSEISSHPSDRRCGCSTFIQWMFALFTIFPPLDTTRLCTPWRPSTCAPRPRPRRWPSWCGSWPSCSPSPPPLSGIIGLSISQVAGQVMHQATWPNVSTFILMGFCLSNNSRLFHGAYDSAWMQCY